MKRSKAVFALKLGLIIILLLSAIYFIVQQVQESEEPDYTSTVDYRQAESITQVIPGGVMTGIYAETRGVLCLGIGNIPSESGDISSPAEGIVKKGDYFLSCNGKALDSKEELIEAVANSQGQNMKFVLLRDEKEIEVSIQPVFADGEYRLGVWVRDDIAGIGMITYVTSQLQFGALGHGITDMDLGIEMNIKEGSLHEARITDIRRGEEGNPGQLIGYINYRASKPNGYIYNNSSCGIRGEMNDLPDELEDVSYVSIGDSDDVHKGDALLICDVSGERVAYNIEIEKIYNLFSTDNKNFTIHVTDERLLELTGGIVQGMSGAPIIQDGKLIGAVTHVLVDDPTRGYGIFIEKMLDIE